jgi:O-antigen biosynthesis protein WbqV
MDQARKTAIHIAVAFAAFLVAYEIPYGRDIAWWMTSRDVPLVLEWAAIYALLAALFEILFQVERASWRFVSVSDAIALFRSTALTAATFLAVAFLANRALVIPRSTLLLAWALHLGGLTGLRLLRRALYERSLASALVPFLRRSRRSELPALVIVGAVDQADSALRELARSPKPEYWPAALISPLASDVGQQIRGVRVVAEVEQFSAALTGLKMDGVAPKAILFLDEPSRAGLSPEQIGRLKADGVRLLRLPRIQELTSAEARTGGMGVREISFEELLSRAPIKLDLERMRDLIAGRRVLVTGAGGSIGSEICRQVAALGCARLMLLENSEFALFQIDREIGDAHPELSRQELLCDVRDRNLVRDWFLRERPEVVFHAAALKHVHLVENHPCEGALTNVIGTWNVADAACAADTAHVVLISTDKAVDPSNVMGATKRLAETVVRTRDCAVTRFSIVRFGNVLGSTGSVVPVFKSQIERGGPVTVTHEAVERFFMTIPEAVQLVLHASAMSAAEGARDARLFVLEMGEPVRIYDLARQMIELYGKTPGVDIEIQVTGLRPGEKLSEILIDTTETSVSCAPGVQEIVAGASLNGLLADTELKQLEKLARSGDAAAVRTLVRQLVGNVRNAGPGAERLTA